MASSGCKFQIYEECINVTPCLLLSFNSNSLVATVRYPNHAEGRQRKRHTLKELQAVEALEM